MENQSKITLEYIVKPLQKITFFEKTILDLDQMSPVMDIKFL